MAARFGIAAGLATDCNPGASRSALIAGGDGRFTYALPNIQPNCKPSGFCLTYCVAMEGIYPPRS